MPFNKPMELASTGELVPIMPQQSFVLCSDEPALLQLTDLSELQQLCSSLVAFTTAGFCSEQECAATVVFTGAGVGVQQQACLGVPYRKASRTKRSGSRRFNAVPCVPDNLISSIRLMTTVPQSCRRERLLEERSDYFSLDSF